MDMKIENNLFIFLKVYCIIGFVDGLCQNMINRGPRGYQILSIAEKHYVHIVKINLMNSLASLSSKACNHLKLINNK